MVHELRRHAEAHIRTKRKNQKMPSERSLSKPDSKRLLHELQVHQIELELQNEELRKTKAEIELERDKFSELYDFAPIGYITVGRDGTITEANLAGASMFGIARAALIKRRFGAFVCPSDRSAFARFFQRVLRSNAREECDVRLLLKPEKFVDVRIRALGSNDAQSCRMAVTDVTERNRAEARVRTSEIRYRRLFEAAQDGVLLLDPATGKITDANPFMTSLLGYSHDQFVGKTLFEIGLFKDEGASWKMFEQLKRDQEVRYEDLPLRNKSSRHQHVEVVANLYQENGHTVVQCNIRDVSARKQAQDILLRNKALFSGLIERAPVGIYVVDASFKIQQVNRTALPAFQKAQPLLGRDFSEIVHMLWPKRIADHVEKQFRHTLKTGEPYQSPEFVARRQDLGVEEIYEWQIQRVILPADDYGVVCFFNNITERKRAEARQRRIEVLSASNRRLEKEIVRRQKVEESLRKSDQNQAQLLQQSRLLQKQLRQLSRQILTAQEEERREISRELHDVIGQTLAGINIQLTTLAKEAALDISSIIPNIRLTQRLVEKSVEIVHKFARDLRPAVLDDLGLIPALAGYIKSFSARTGIRVSLRTSVPVEILNSAQRTALFRVAQEALINVARHAQANRVTVSFKKSTGSLCMRVADDGKSFDVQHTLNSEGHKRLGLLGMRERLEMVNGCFDVESAPGKGTTIVAWIPFSDETSLLARSAEVTN